VIAAWAGAAQGVIIHAQFEEAAGVRKAESHWVGNANDAYGNCELESLDVNEVCRNCTHGLRRVHAAEDDPRVGIHSLHRHLLELVF
jgi:hypothetical protein